MDERFSSLEVTPDDSFLASVYSCASTEICLIKYVCGGVSLVFVILFAIAVIRVKRKKTLDLDLKDQILLSLAFSETILILVYHIFYTHLILLFLIRTAKMLEQVTICLILVELTVKILNLLKAFLISVGVSALAVLIVLVILLFERNYDFLNEQKLFWTILSGIQVIISLATMVLGVKLMCQDPSWNDQDYAAFQNQQVLRASAVDGGGANM